MFDELKTALESLTGWSRDALHVHVGLLLFCSTLAVTRRALPLLAGIGVIAALTILNEVMDYRRIVATDDPFSIREAVGDVVGTVLWPLVLLALLADRRS